MNQGVYIALSGAKLQELRLDIASNNLANSTTSGYKADNVSSRKFEFELDSAIDDWQLKIRPPDPKQILNDIDGLDLPLPGYKGVYSKTVEVSTSFKQGYDKFTGNPLNIALEGPGFIALDTSNGTRYTRQGGYALNNKGELLTSDGLRVRGKGLSGLGDGLIDIDSEGNVFLDGLKKGNIDIVEFDDPAILQKEGHNLFVLKQKGNLEQKPENTTVKQGFLEMANINVMKEMVSLIELHRMYESYQKIMTSIDESTKQVINDVGRK